MSIRSGCVTMLCACALMGVPAQSTAATLAVVATDDGAVNLYRLSKNLGIMIPIKSIPAGKSPVGMCGDPGGTRLYVSEVPEKVIAGRPDPMVDLGPLSPWRRPGAATEWMVAAKKG